jgi:hypothetical protein
MRELLQFLVIYPKDQYLPPSEKSDFLPPKNDRKLQFIDNLILFLSVINYPKNWIVLWRIKKT